MGVLGYVLHAIHNLERAREVGQEGKEVCSVTSGQGLLRRTVS